VRMSVSKIPASPKNYPDEYERRFRVGGARPACVEDVGLAELARKLAPVRPSAEARAVSEYEWGAAPIEAATRHSAIDFVRSRPGGPARRDLEATQISGFRSPVARSPLSRSGDGSALKTLDKDARARRRVAVVRGRAVCCGFRA
jgi:hypothetical protein